MILLDYKVKFRKVESPFTDETRYTVLIRTQFGRGMIWENIGTVQSGTSYGHNSTNGSPFYVTTKPTKYWTPRVDNDDIGYQMTTRKSATVRLIRRYEESQ